MRHHPIKHPHSNLACRGTESTTLTSAASTKTCHSETVASSNLDTSATSNAAMASNITDTATTQLTIKNGSGKPAITGSSIPESANDSARFFDFFGLPRELRDKIYEQPVLFEYEHLPTISAKDMIAKVKKLRTSLLLVSQEFREE